MTSDQIAQIKCLAASGLKTLEVHSMHFPDFEPWQIHNVIHFDGKFQNEQSWVQNLLEQNPSLAARPIKGHGQEVSESVRMILAHEFKIIESKFLASEAHRKKSLSR